MFKRDDLQKCFRIFRAVCRLFSTIKIVVVLLVTDLTSNTIFLTQYLVLKMVFSSSMFSTNIAQCLVLTSQI